MTNNTPIEITRETPWYETFGGEVVCPRCFVLDGLITDIERENLEEVTPHVFDTCMYCLRDQEQVINDDSPE